MKLAQLAARIDARIKSAVDEICAQRGLRMNRFVEEALLDKLEELEDLNDLKRIRFEKTRPLSVVLKELKLDGKV